MDRRFLIKLAGDAGLDAGDIVAGHEKRALFGLTPSKWGGPREWWDKIKTDVLQMKWDPDAPAEIPEVETGLKDAVRGRSFLGNIGNSLAGIVANKFYGVLKKL